MIRFGATGLDHRTFKNNWSEVLLSYLVAREEFLTH